MLEWIRNWALVVSLVFITALSIQGKYKAKKELKEVNKQMLVQQERYKTLQNAIIAYTEENQDANKELQNSLKEVPQEDQEILNRRIPDAVRNSLCNYTTCK